MSIEVQVGVNAARFRKGLEQMKGEAQKFNDDLGKMAAGKFTGLFSNFTAGGLVSSLDQIISKAGEIKKLSAQFGVNTQSLQQLGNGLAGGKLEEIGPLLNKLTSNQAKAREGNKELAASFAVLGVSTKDLNNLPLDDLLYRIADGTKNATDRGRAYAAVEAVLGKEAGEFYSKLEKGSQALKENADAMGIYSQAAINSFAGFNKQIDILKSHTLPILADVSAALLRVGHAGASGWKQGLNGVKSFVKLGRDLSSSHTRKGAFDRFGKRLDKEADKSWAGLKQIWHPEDPVKPSAKPDGKPVEDAAAMAKLQAEIAEEQERNRTDGFAGEAKINDLLKERAALAAKVNESTVEGLEAKKKLLDVEHRIAAAQKEEADRVAAAKTREADLLDRQALAKMNPREQIDALKKKQDALYDQARRMEQTPGSDPAKAIEARTKADEVHGQIDTLKKSQAEELKRARQGEVDELEKQYLDKASPQDRRKYLKDKQGKLMKESEDAEKAGDSAKATEKRTQAEAINPELENTKEDKNGKKFVSVVADSLQRAGGGGGRGGGHMSTGQDRAERQRQETNALLKQLVEATKKKDADGGSGTGREAY